MYDFYNKLLHQAEEFILNVFLIVILRGYLFYFKWCFGMTDIVDSVSTMIRINININYKICPYYISKILQ